MSGSRSQSPKRITSPTAQLIVGEYLGTKYVLAHATPDMGLLNDGTNSWKLHSPTRPRSVRRACRRLPAQRTAVPSSAN